MKFHLTMIPITLAALRMLATAEPTLPGIQPPQGPLANNELWVAPQIESDGHGTIIAVWNGSYSGGEEIGVRFSVSRDSGQTWSNPASIDPVVGPSDPEPNKLPCGISTDRHGRWAVIWSERANTAQHLFVSRSLDDGATWLPKVQLDSLNSLYGIGRAEPIADISSDGMGSWVAVWRGSETDEFSNDLYFSRSVGDKTTWSPRQPLTSNAGQDNYREYYPDLATDHHGTLIASWSAVNGSGGPQGTDYDIFYTRTDDGGQTWSPIAPLNPDAVTDDVDDGFHDQYCSGGPRLISDELGNWAAIWIRPSWDEMYQFNLPALFSSRSTNNGATWSSPYDIMHFIDPSIALYNSTLTYDASSRLLTLGVNWPFLTTGGGGDVLYLGFLIKFATSADFALTWPGMYSLCSENPNETGAVINQDIAVQADGNGRLVAMWNRAGDNILTGIYRASTVDVLPSQDTYFNFTYNSGSADGWTSFLNPVAAAKASIPDSPLSATVTPGGLCLADPKTGENVAQFTSPERTLPLVEGTVWRLTAEVSTDQTGRDAIPRWQIGYDNVNSAFSKGNNYGGVTTFLDAAKGAEGIGRRNGRTTFETWIMPAAATTPQWNGDLADGTLGAFDPANDPFNDIRLWFRVSDLDSGGYGAERDAGTICLKSLRAERYPLSTLTVDQTLYDVPISNATHWAFDKGQSPQLAAIDDAAHLAYYQLNTTSDVATLLPALDLNPPRRKYKTKSFFPVHWADNTLYRITAQIQLAETSSGIDPLDMLQLNATVPTKELSQTAWVTRGAPDDFDRAGSPRKASAAGGPQTYTLYFYGNNASDLSKDWARWLKPSVDLLNSPDLNGTGTGADAVQVLGLKVEKMVVPQN